MIDFVNELRKAYHGNAWHGNNVSVIISSVKDDQAFKRPIPNAHTIAEIVMHLTSWTEEVISRLAGNAAKDPDKGDWPVSPEETPQQWNAIVSDFYIANETLVNLAMNITEDQWRTRVNQTTETEHNYSELLNGLIQHHAYHAGQISLLLKF